MKRNIEFHFVQVDTIDWNSFSRTNWTNEISEKYCQKVAKSMPEILTEDGHIRNEWMQMLLEVSNNIKNIRAKSLKFWKLFGAGSHEIGI